MSSQFDELMRKISVPSAEDIAADIKLPTVAQQEKQRRKREEEAKQAAETARVHEANTDGPPADVSEQQLEKKEGQGGQEAREEQERRERQEKGGANSSSGANTSSTVGGVSGTSAPEPAPQRDEPDDGEHTNSQPEPEALPEEPETSADDDSSAEHSDEDSDAEDTDEEDEAEKDRADEEAASPAAESSSSAAARADGSASSTARRAPKTGYSVGDAEMIGIKRLPLELVTALRKSLEPAVGEAFTRDMSVAALVTAFLMARTGVELDADANTAKAAGAFRSVDPRLLAVEKGQDEMRADFKTMADTLKIVLLRFSETSRVTDSLDLQLSWLLADRVDQFSSIDTTSDTVDLVDPRALKVRKRSHAAAETQRKIEQRTKGRRMS